MASRKRSISNDADMSAMYKEWDEASCPICMEHPHNAVLLICSSHGKGCRSYICDTSYRHSNCLDRFKKLKEETTDSISAPGLMSESHHGSNDSSTRNLDSTIPVDAAGGHLDYIPTESASVVNLGMPGASSMQNADSDFEEQVGTLWGTLSDGETNLEKPIEGSDLRCPLCRGSVLGWKVVEDARKYLNQKSRSCSHESCSFLGNYRELRGHARRVHPTIRPADVDPLRQRAWRRLEDQREYNDIVSAIHSAMPGAIILGDYAMETGDRVLGESDRTGAAGEGGRLLSTLFLFQMIGSMDRGGERRSGRPRMLARHRRASGTSFSRRRYLWGENLLGLQENDDGDVEQEDQPLLGDLGDDVHPSPRRRRRLTRAQSDEN